MTRDEILQMLRDQQAQRASEEAEYQKRAHSPPVPNEPRRPKFQVNLHHDVGWTLYGFREWAAYATGVARGLPLDPTPDGKFRRLSFEFEHPEDAQAFTELAKCAGQVSCMRL